MPANRTNRCRADTIDSKLRVKPGITKPVLQNQYYKPGQAKKEVARLKSRLPMSANFPGKTNRCEVIIVFLDGLTIAAAKNTLTSLKFRVFRIK